MESHWNYCEKTPYRRICCAAPPDFKAGCGSVRVRSASLGNVNLQTSPVGGNGYTGMQSLVLTNEGIN